MSDKDLVSLTDDELDSAAIELRARLRLALDEYGTRSVREAFKTTARQDVVEWAIYSLMNDPPVQPGPVGVERATAAGQEGLGLLPAYCRIAEEYERRRRPLPRGFAPMPIAGTSEIPSHRRGVPLVETSWHRLIPDAVTAVGTDPWAVTAWLKAHADDKKIRSDRVATLLDRIARLSDWTFSHNVREAVDMALHLRANRRPSAALLRLLGVAPNRPEISLGLEDEMVIAALKWPGMRGLTGDEPPPIVEVTTRMEVRRCLVEIGEK